MHCKGCDCLMSDRETTRKTESGEYLDLCDTCYEPIREEVTTVPGYAHRYDDNLVTIEEIEHEMETEDQTSES